MHHTRGPGNLSQCDVGRGRRLTAHVVSRFADLAAFRVAVPTQDGFTKALTPDKNKKTKKTHVAMGGAFRSHRARSPGSLSWVSGCRWDGLRKMKAAALRRPASAPESRVPARPQFFWALRPEDVPDNMRSTKGARAKENSSPAYAHDPTSWLIHRLGLEIWKVIESSRTDTEVMEEGLNSEVSTANSCVNPMLLCVQKSKYTRREEWNLVSRRTPVVYNLCPRVLFQNHSRCNWETIRRNGICSSFCLNIS